MAVTFQRVRPRLTRAAYATTGSYADAEDIVSDCWLKLVLADRRAAIQDVEAWALVAVARAALDLARSARRRRETYIGPWLPEPIVDQTRGVSDPLELVTLDEHVSYALLVVLESLSPAARTAWVLHDVFRMPFAEIATTVGRTPAAVRQLASRARSHIRSQIPRTPVTSEQHEHTVRQFRDAAAGGDLHGLLRILDPGVVLTSDGNGKVPAARRPVHGDHKVAHFACVVFSRPSPNSLRIITVNGRTAIGTYDGEKLTGAVTLRLDGKLIDRINSVRSPDKLSARCNPHILKPNWPM